MTIGDGFDPHGELPSTVGKIELAKAENVVTLREWNPAEATKPQLHDIPALLRSVADEIEKGESGAYGDVVRLAMVLRSRGREPIIFGQGPTDINTTFADLHAGALQLLMMDSPEHG